MHTVDSPVNEDGTPRLEDPLAAELGEMSQQFSIHEPYWVTRLIERDPVSLPYVRNDISRDRLPAARIRHELVCEDQRFSGQPSEATARVVAAICLYLGRLCGKEAFDLDFRGQSLQSLPDAARSHFAAAVPLAIRLNWSDSFRDHVEHVGTWICEAEAHGTYARDLTIRTPQIEAEHRQRLRSVPDVAVAIVPTDREDVPNSPRPSWYLRSRPTRRRSRCWRIRTRWTTNCWRRSPKNSNTFCCRSTNSRGPHERFRRRHAPGTSDPRGLERRQSRRIRGQQFSALV